MVIMSLNYRSLLFVVLFTTVLFSFKLGSYALVDMDEPRYPQAAREMIAKGEYIVPQFAETRRYDKPILFYWSEILSIKVFGDNEFAARLPSAISALALVLICFLFGSSVGVSVLSSVVLATSLEFFIMARLSVTDMLLNLCISSTLIIFFLCYSRKLNDKFLLLAAVSAALGLLCKGPVALVLPGLIIVAYLLSDKNLIAYFKRIAVWLPWITMILLAIALPWYIAVDQATGGEFTKAFFLEHNLNRYTSTLSGHKAAWWFYIPVFLVGFMPWTLVLPKALRDWFIVRSDKSYENDLIRFCLIWFVSVIVFYSLASTKLINYILPCYLPLAMIVALYLKELPMKTVTTLVLIWGTALMIAVPLVLMPMSKTMSGGIIKFASMLPTDVQQVFTVNMERPSVTYYTHKAAKRITSAKLLRKLNRSENLYFVIKTNDLKEIQEAKNSYQIMFQEGKYSFGKS